jgi:predicted RNA-binding Zn ribbon-like protein
MNDATGLTPAIALIRDFVNTREPQLDSESLTDARELERWLTSRELIPADAGLGQAELDLALTIRESIRGVLLSHHGDGDTTAAADRLTEALARVPVRLAFTPGGLRLVACRPEPFEQAVAGLIDAIRQSTEDHTWTNLKVCARDSCRWAFYDNSRNHGRRWCSMAGCGNHVKMKRAYATRKQRQGIDP